MVNHPSRLVTNIYMEPTQGFLLHHGHTHVLNGSSLMGTQQFDPAYQYQAGQSGQQRPIYPLNTGLPPYGE